MDLKASWRISAILSQASGFWVWESSSDAFASFLYALCASSCTWWPDALRNYFRSTMNTKGCTKDTKCYVRLIVLIVKTLHNGGLCIFTESIFLFPMTGRPAITTSCILPMTIYPTMITTGLRPVSRHFNIPVAVPCPFRAYPNCTTIGCGAGGTDRNPYAKYGFRPYKLRICSKNGKAKQHYCYKNYLFHSVVF